MGLSPLRRVIAAFSGEKIDKAPVTSIAGCGGTVTVDMQRKTGVHWPKAHKDSKKMAKLSVASHKMTGIENARVPFDFVVEPEALGCEIRWWNEMETVPSVKKHPYESPQDLKMPEKLLEKGRIPVVLEAIAEMRETVGDFLPISSLALGPFSLAGELAGTERLFRWILKKPKYVEEFVDFTTEIVIEYARAQYRAGSNIVEVADAMASIDMISPKMFREFVKPALMKITRALKGIIVLHICGRTAPIITDIIETGFDGVSVDVEVAYIKPLAGEVRILGNVSSKKTLIFGSTDDVRAECKTALEAGVDLLEPECGFSPITPIENIKAMVEARDEYYA